MSALNNLPADAELRVRAVFARVDQLEIPAFQEMLSDNVELRFGNSPPAYGKQAATSGISELFSQLNSMKHDFRAVWEVPGRKLVLVASITYERKDGKFVTIPGVTILHFEAERFLYSKVEVFMDMTPLFEK